MGEKSGDPMGIRTPVTTVKGSCPRPLDDRVADTNFQNLFITVSW